MRIIFLLPGIVTVLIPYGIIHQTDSLKLQWPPHDPVDLLPLFTGVFLVCIGLGMVVKTGSPFTQLDEGSPVPWDPPKELIATGIYLHVRNPLISGILAILLGETLLLGSLPLLLWFIFFLLVNFIYIRFFEESHLEQRFGDEYLCYKDNVPRWIPRIKPWSGVAGYTYRKGG
jgi:protein-S-isoprenylcysteine O-methyltransferase Ste14